MILSKDKEYEKAVVKLKNNGDVSALIQTETGFAIIQRVDRKEATYKDFDDVYDAIEASLREQKFKRIFAKDTERFIRNSENTELDKFISQHKGSEKNVGPVQKNDGQQFQRLFMFTQLVIWIMIKGLIVSSHTFQHSFSR